MEGSYRKGINLGRLWNKYLIIEIQGYAAEEHAMEESEQLLWIWSVRHRSFLARNR